jgi:hypothetical protein
MRKLRQGKKKMVVALWKGAWQLYEKGLCEKERKIWRKKGSTSLILKYFNSF